MYAYLQENKSVRPIGYMLAAIVIAFIVGFVVGILLILITSITRAQ